MLSWISQKTLRIICDVDIRIYWFTNIFFNLIQKRNHFYFNFISIFSLFTHMCFFCKTLILPFLSSSFMPKVMPVPYFLRGLRTLSLFSLSCKNPNLSSCIFGLKNAVVAYNYLLILSVFYFFINRLDVVTSVV